MPDHKPATLEKDSDYDDIDDDDDDEDEADVSILTASVNKATLEVPTRKASSLVARRRVILENGSWRRAGHRHSTATQPSEA